MRPPLSVVIPARDEAARLPALLGDLAGEPALVREVLVVDGDSRDATALVAALAGARVLASRPGRGVQLAAGAAASEGSWLLFLHADVRLPSDWGRVVAAAITAEVVDAPCAWSFRLAVDDPDPALRLVELGVGLRSRWRGLPYGDQGLLLRRSLYLASGGFAPLPLMEDLEFVQRLRSHARLRLLDAALRVDARRWRRLGVWRTTWSNALLRRAWRQGVPPEDLARRYRSQIPRGQGAYQKAQRRFIGSSSQPWAS
jgi:rSAM/selenodomain-associated transferase 2